MTSARSSGGSSSWGSLAARDWPLAAALTRPLLRGLNRVAVVAEQAMVDPLTGSRIGEGRPRARDRARAIGRRGHPCALVIVDLDDFKQVNDRNGHAVGDEVLVTLADRLRDSVRSADTVARLGGEEFALLLPETDLSGALAVAQRARELRSRQRRAPRGTKRSSS